MKLSISSQIVSSSEDQVGPKNPSTGRRIPRRHFPGQRAMRPNQTCASGGFSGDQAEFSVIGIGPCRFEQRAHANPNPRAAKGREETFLEIDLAEQCPLREVIRDRSRTGPVTPADAQPGRQPWNIIVSIFGTGASVRGARLLAFRRLGYRRRLGGVQDLPRTFAAPLRGASSVFNDLFD